MARPQPGSARVTSQVTAQLTMERRLVFAVFAPSGARSGQAFDCNTSLAGSALSHSVMARLNGRGIALCPGNPALQGAD